MQGLVSTGPSRVVYWTYAVYIVSVLGQDEGYSVKYIPLRQSLPDGVPEGEA